MRVLIVVDGGHTEGCSVFDAADLATSITALKQAIANHPIPNLAVTVEIVSDDELSEVMGNGFAVPAEGDSPGARQMESAIAAPAPDWIKSFPSVLLCPLTLNLPQSLPKTFGFPGQAIYSTCRDTIGLRQWVEQHLETPTGEGKFWLPIVLTAKGALYAEVIGKRGSGVRHQGLGENNQTSESGLSFQQPIHLSDRWRQPLYRLGHRLLKALAAPPSVYLLQFGFQGEQICFDRLLPFPAAPAIASIGIQTPDLFTCYWRCLTHQPILDLVIGRSVSYGLWEAKEK